MTPEEFANKMREIVKECEERKGQNDAEIIHEALDDCMCDLLRELGYDEGVDFFLAQERWYA